MDPNVYYPGTFYKDYMESTEHNNAYVSQPICRNKLIFGK